MKVNVECNRYYFAWQQDVYDSRVKKMNRLLILIKKKSEKKGNTGNAFPEVFHIFMQCESYAGNSSQIVFGGNHYKCKIVYAKVFEIRLVEASVEGSFTKQVVIL